MKKERFLILILVVLVLVVGCESLGGKKDTTVSGVFVGGSEGLGIEFVKDEPPNVVLDNSQESFNIALLLKNKGEYDVPAGKVIASLGGIDRDSFGLSSLDTTLSRGIEGVTKRREAKVEGGEEELRFKNLKYKHDLKSDFRTSVRVDVCYLYETNAVASLCLKKEASAHNIDDACEIDNSNVKVDNSGAPVKISNLDQRPAGSNQIRFSFQIDKGGSGNVYLPEQFSSDCHGASDDDEWVRVELSTPGGRVPIKCGSLDESSKGDVKLLNKKRVVSCTIETQGLQENAFEAPLNLDIKYFYRVALEKGLAVEDSS